MRFTPGKILLAAVFCSAFFIQPILADELSESVEKDYEQHLGTLFDYFHRNP